MGRSGVCQERMTIAEFEETVRHRDIDDSSMLEGKSHLLVKPKFHRLG